MKIIKLLLIAPLGIFAACAPARVSGAVAVSGPAYVGPPQLAYVGPGVEVVSDWGTPVFFADDFFWEWDGGFWYRSSVLGGPRLRVHEVPGVVARIERPSGYAHFHAGMHASRPVPVARMHGDRMARRR